MAGVIPHLSGYKKTWSELVFSTGKKEVGRELLSMFPFPAVVV